MKNLTLSLATTFLLGTFSLSAQKGHTNYYKTPASIEKDQYSLSFSDLVSETDYSKFAFKLKNNTSDYLLIDKGGSSFVINGKEYKDKDKEILVKPSKTHNGVYRVKDETDFHVDKYTFSLTAFLYYLQMEKYTKLLISSYQLLPTKLLLAILL